MGRLKELLKKILPPPVNAFNREIAYLKADLSAVIDERHRAEMETLVGIEKMLTEIDKNCHAEQEMMKKIEENFDTSQRKTERVIEQLCHDLLQDLWEAATRVSETHSQSAEKILIRQEELIQRAGRETANLLAEKYAAQMKESQSDRYQIMKKIEADTGKIYYYCPFEVDFIERSGFYTYRTKPDFLERYQALVCGLDRESLETVNRILSRQLLLRGKPDQMTDLFSDKEQQAIAAQRSGFYANTPELLPGIFACGKYLIYAPKSGMGYTETTVFVDRIGLDKLDHPERIRQKDILDLGAFIGDSALILSEATDHMVYAFEPGQGNFEAMEKNLEINHCKNVTAVHAGIGAHGDTAYIRSNLNMGHTLVETVPLESTEQMDAVSICSVDEFVAAHHLNVGLIKVDIEGYEREFLKGAEQTIRTQKPALLLSIYHSAEDFFELKPYIESWNLGYHFKIHKEINEHIYLDTLLIAEAE